VRNAHEIITTETKKHHYNIKQLATDNRPNLRLNGKPRQNT